MHPPHVRAEALALVEQGLNDCEISRRLGIPRRTVLDWRRPTYVPREPAIPRETCPRCWHAAKHGVGRKPERDIKLEPWQSTIVETAPWSLIRGLIRTDGCHFINRADIHRPKLYQYLSYDFSNMSKDIVDLFVDSCQRVGVFTRTTGGGGRRWSVRINRRESVSMMVEHVGFKK